MQGTLVMNGTPFDVVSTRLRNGKFEVIGEAYGPDPGWFGGRCNIRLYDGDAKLVFDAPSVEVPPWGPVDSGRRFTAIQPVAICEVVEKCE